jgi:hypothetical protein
VASQNELVVKTITIVLSNKELESVISCASVKAIAGLSAQGWS